MNPTLPAVSDVTPACLGYTNFDFVCHLSRQMQAQEESDSADTFATWLLCEQSHAVTPLAIQVPH